jgi:hypothetical protein
MQTAVLTMNPEEDSGSTIRCQVSTRRYRNSNSCRRGDTFRRYSGCKVRWCSTCGTFLYLAAICWLWGCTTGATWPGPLTNPLHRPAPLPPGPLTNPLHRPTPLQRNALEGTVAEAQASGCVDASSCSRAAQRPVQTREVTEEVSRLDGPGDSGWSARSLLQDTQQGDWQQVRHPSDGFALLSDRSRVKGLGFKP